MVQTAYHIKAAAVIDDLNINENLFWNTGKVISDQSVHIEYDGKKLISGSRIYWKVKIWDNAGNESEWSEPSFFETGLLNSDDWKASWISPAVEEDVSSSTPCPFLRKEFSLNKKIKSARIYASAKGLYELSLNGEKVGDELFTPGWTSYQKRIQYQVFDVTEQLNTGENCIGVILGDGWYRGYLVWQGEKNTYGDKTALILQLRIIYTDDTEELIVSDDSWKSTTGSILKSDIYNGEVYDARMELKGWEKPGFKEENWKSVNITDKSVIMLVASEGNPVKITKSIEPIEKIITPKNEVVYDLGQNIVGWVRITVKGNRGSKIIIHHAEVLDKEGNFYTENLRAAKAEDVYILNGGGEETFEPHFTFHGFRYIRILGLSDDVRIINILGQVIHSDMDPVGEFECSDKLVNQLQKNIQWGLKGNFLDVPTDCPQRDERLGWTGDAQVFASTANYNMNTAPFYTKWMKDLAIDQKDDGSVPWVVPNVIKDGGGTGWGDGFGATGWADAAVIIPWEVYLSFGDKKILENQYESMKSWVLYMKKHAGDRYIFDHGFHFGDWLAFAEYFTYQFNAPDYGYAGAYTEKDLIATAYFYHSTHLMSKIAKILNHKEDAVVFDNLLPKIKKAFLHEFMTPSGRLTSGTQTAYVLALSFGLIPDEFKKVAIKKLCDDILYFGHLTTGFLGTPHICHALSENGNPEIAYKLLFNKRYPSWLYPVTMGATTIWERWDGIKPDGTFQTAGMNSFNHYAYGAIGNWMYTNIGGVRIDPEKPGYKHIILKPVISENLSFARASLETIYGKVLSHWVKHENKMEYLVTIPANTNATVILPCSKNHNIMESGKPVSGILEIIIQKQEPDYIVLNIGSGTYHFEII